MTLKSCAICRREFDSDAAAATPAEELGAFLAEEMFGDAGALCPVCRESRGQLAMMYLREFD